MEADTRPPLHESLTVLDSTDIYRTDEWWKAVVRYQFNSSADYSEVATYLWHYDGNWTRKNKYVIKTADAWATDITVVDSLLSEDLTTKPQHYEELPVSDYYSVGAGETIFRSDGWWKAILRIDQKGTYETQEVMIYVWQDTDEGWRRRQKYAIKNKNDWKEEKSVIDHILGSDARTTSRTNGQKTIDADQSMTEKDPSSELRKLHRELEDHISEGDLN